MTANSPPPTGRPKRASAGAKLILTFFAVVLCAAGAVGTWMLWRAYQRAVDQYGWTEMPCAIVRSELKEERLHLNSPVQWRPVVEYTYLSGNVSCKGRSIRTVDGSFVDRTVAEGILSRYKPGQSTVCYVNPANPDQAILERATKAPLYSLWFPLLFVIGGLGMILHVWWPQGTEDAPKGEKSSTVTADQ